MGGGKVWPTGAGEMPTILRPILWILGWGIPPFVGVGIGPAADFSRLGPNEYPGELADPEYPNGWEDELGVWVVRMGGSVLLRIILEMST